ncbi:bifunctional 3-phenylpropionate/cinnamic acid dioxygenase ferredoxin subunit [Kitasatospora sp. NPDC005856]|uniref:bifunctional 3-phenylpropionate/cinnamic acid dioxygenase ferredoxin subunit n=1 Tax=Kitasatospora sp. NPDC005856 TaxID=3154566 RepID=UPI00340F192C
MSGRELLIGAVGEVPDGEAVLVPANETGTGAAIAVFNDGGSFYAIDDTCTHGAASLAEGWAEDGRVECPLHGGAFCLRTGEAVALPASAGVLAHRVDVRDGQVWLTPTAVE